MYKTMKAMIEACFDKDLLIEAMLDKFEIDYDALAEEILETMYPDLTTIAEIVLDMMD